MIAPPGFSFSGVAAGLKKRGALDLGAIVSDLPAAAAGVFTRNKFRAAPVLLTRRRVRAGHLQAILVNAGNANACTGRQGAADARRTSEAFARALGVPAPSVGVCSTGVIGQRLPADRLIAGIPALVGAARPDGVDDFAAAIMTTDTAPKVVAAAGKVGGRRVQVVGVAKGSGMIEPGMATMLAFAVTDAAADPAWLKAALRRVTNRTFNRVTVDGDGSTNDTFLALAGGNAGNDPDAPAGLEDLLGEVAEGLALAIARDGEGATKLVHVRGTGAASDGDAERVAREIANSPLVKTALFGEDANWGRVVMAVGNARARVRPELELGVDLGLGSGEATIHTCDLSLDYIRINADYRS